MNSTELKKISVSIDGERICIPDDQEIAEDYLHLSDRLNNHRLEGKKIVAVLGLGFVGAAASAVISAAEGTDHTPLYIVVGIDLPSPDGYWKVSKIKRGQSPFPSPDPDLPKFIHRGVLERQNLYATVSAESMKYADIIVVDIALDVSDRAVFDPQDIEINLTGFEAGVRTVGQWMREDALVIIETTVPIGTLERVVKPLLMEERSKRGIVAPLYLAHAYERVMPGPYYIDSIRRYWRTYTGIDQVSSDKAKAFLETIIDTKQFPLWELNNPNSSEMAKLLENSYRSVNIAFIYEWTLLAEEIGINLFEVIDSIRVRKGTHDNMRYPGLGVGGYCLTKDSLLAQWSASHHYDSDIELSMTLEALRINYHMPEHTFQLAKRMVGGELIGKTVLICGVSYLAEVPDTRNSPTEILASLLLSEGVNLLVHDPYVQVWSELPGLHVFDSLDDLHSKADLVIFAVPHKVYRELEATDILKLFASNIKAIADAQNILTDDAARDLHHAGCKVIGVGKGHWIKKGYQS